MLCKGSGMYIDIYFILKITFFAELQIAILDLTFLLCYLLNSFIALHTSGNRIKVIVYFK